MEYAVALIALVLGGFGGYVLRRALVKRQIGSLEQVAAGHAGGGKDEVLEVLLEAKKEEKHQKEQLTALEHRLLEREETIDKRLLSVSDEEKELRKKEDVLKEKEGEIALLRDKAEEELRKVTGLSAEEAKQKLFDGLKSRYAEDLAKSAQFFETERRVRTS